MKTLKARLASFGNIKNEEREICRIFKTLGISTPKILDVGCGYGRNLALLKTLGLDCTGVDVNATLVQDCKNRGFKALSIAEFESSNEKYDVLLMSHVVEHFQPDSLKSFLEHYLERLNDGGHLVIATPLFSKHFFDDFDHVKPYQPTGMTMVFGSKSAQVQYYGKHRLTLKDIWFRRSPLRIHYARCFYVQGYSRLPKLVNLCLALLFRLTFGIIAETDGWIGLYKKEFTEANPEPTR